VPFEEKNLVGAGLTTVGTLLVFGNYAIAAIFAFLTIRYKTHKVIRASQPMFLMLILVGCCVSTTAILFFGQDDGGDYANDGDINCMLQPIFYSLGFTFSFAALFAKITRISKIFGNRRLQKITITWVDMMKPIVALLVVDALLLILWSSSETAALKWTRTPKTVDAMGNTLESVRTIPGLPTTFAR
jgi:gamma-aminobutyric acid type B receptor